MHTTKLLVENENFLPYMYILLCTFTLLSCMSLFLRYNSRSRQVGVYDVRSDAKVPSTGMIGDEIYIPPSETGSSCKSLYRMLLFCKFIQAKYFSTTDYCKFSFRETNKF